MTQPTSHNSLTRREFLCGWFPFFWRRNRVTLDGIPFRTVRRGRSSFSYLLIHGNEETAREVLLEHMRRHQGVAHLVAGHGRYIGLAGGRFDPNRIFSHEGAEKNLRALNPRWDAARLAGALARLDRGREKLVRAILPPPGGLLIALHNNSRGYSVRDEAPVSDRVSLADASNPRDFMLCTAVEDYAALARSPFNVVLQNAGPPDDDGSLSRLAARLGVRYVNIEVALGNRTRQREMLAWVIANRPEGGMASALPEALRPGHVPPVGGGFFGGARGGPAQFAG
ncbi:MAG: hypothetical protein ACE15B_04765 [Bryobacteraceae bacterium]